VRPKGAVYSTMPGSGQVWLATTGACAGQVGRLSSLLPGRYDCFTSAPRPRRRVAGRDGQRTRRSRCLMRCSDVGFR
jgi:hypothetical protein